MIINDSLPLFSIVTCNYNNLSAGILIHKSNFKSREKVVYYLSLVDKSGNELRLKRLSMYSSHYINLASLYYKERIINLLNQEVNYYWRHKLMRFPIIDDSILNPQMYSFKHMPLNILYVIYCKDMGVLEREYIPNFKFVF